MFGYRQRSGHGCPVTCLCTYLHFLDLSLRSTRHRHGRFSFSVPLLFFLLSFRMFAFPVPRWELSISDQVLAPLCEAVVTLARTQNRVLAGGAVSKIAAAARMDCSSASSPPFHSSCNPSKNYRASSGGAVIASGSIDLVYLIIGSTVSAERAFDDGIKTLRTSWAARRSQQRRGRICVHGPAQRMIQHARSVILLRHSAIDHPLPARCSPLPPVLQRRKNV